MKQRFFFNGINVPGNEFAVNQTFQNAGLIFPDIAYTAVPFFDDTAMIAKIASDISVFKGFVKISFHISHFSLHFVLANPATAPEGVSASQGSSRGRVLKRGTSVTDMPAYAPKGHRWSSSEDSILREIVPFAREKWQRVRHDTGTSPEIIRIICFNSHKLKK